MTQEAELIRSNLSNYPLIKSFLGKIIEQRLQIECYTHGMLTAHLLDESSKSDLKGLETVLQFANSCCKDFKLIFQEDKLSQYPDADGKIIDMLAEVKAFEFLCRHSFRDIAKIMPKQRAKTVDYTATRNNHRYAVEVTRLGLAQSDDKQPQYAYRYSTINYGAKCKDSNGYEISMIKEGINKERLQREITNAIDRKYTQIKRFCQGRTGMWKGILIISSGRDYFVMNRYENKAYHQSPEKDFRQALDQAWQSLSQGEADYGYLHHLVITRGKDLAKAIIHPNL